MGRQFGTELLPTLLFRIRYFPYRDKLTPFEMFGEPLPPIPATGRPQTIEMSNYFFLQSLQALQSTTQDVQSRLPPPPVPLLTEPVHRFQPKDLAWVAHLPPPSESWNLPGRSKILTKPTAVNVSRTLAWIHSPKGNCNWPEGR